MAPELWFVETLPVLQTERSALSRDKIMMFSFTMMNVLFLFVDNAGNRSRRQYFQFEHDLGYRTYGTRPVYNCWLQPLRLEYLLGLTLKVNHLSGMNSVKDLTASSGMSPFWSIGFSPTPAAVGSRLFDKKL